MQFVVTVTNCAAHILVQSFKEEADEQKNEDQQHSQRHLLHSTDGRHSTSCRHLQNYKTIFKDGKIHPIFCHTLTVMLILCISFSVDFLNQVSVVLLLRAFLVPGFLVDGHGVVQLARVAQCMLSSTAAKISTLKICKPHLLIEIVCVSSVRNITKQKTQTPASYQHIIFSTIL